MSLQTITPAQVNAALAAEPRLKLIRGVTLRYAADDTVVYCCPLGALAYQAGSGPWRQDTQPLPAVLDHLREAGVLTDQDITSGNALCFTAGFDDSLFVTRDCMYPKHRVRTGVCAAWTWGRDLARALAIR